VVVQEAQEAQVELEDEEEMVERQELVEMVVQKEQPQPRAPEEMCMLVVLRGKTTPLEYCSMFGRQET